MGDDDSSKTEETFTRAQVRNMIAAEVRKAREQFADYDELKSAADAAGKSQDKIDQVLSKLEAAEARASKAELANTRREIADELGLTAKEARRLSGKTREELLADGRDMIDDLGIDVEARKRGSKSAPAAKPADDDGTDDDSAIDDAADDEPQQRQQAPARGRPRESLRSGAPVARSEQEETDPLKLVAGVPRR